MDAGVETLAAASLGACRRGRRDDACLGSRDLSVLRVLPDAGREGCSRWRGGRLRWRDGLPRPMVATWGGDGDHSRRVAFGSVGGPQSAPDCLWTAADSIHALPRLSEA